MAEIKLDHVDLDTPAFIVRVEEISAAVAASTPLAALAPKLAPLDALVLILKTKNAAVGVAEQVLRTANTELDVARVNVEVSVRALAKSSEGETQDAAELQAGGWHLRGVRGGPVGPMPAPMNVNCTAGDKEGQVDSAWDAVKGRNSYVGEHAVAATGPWIQFYLGKASNCTATGLVSGTLYYFRFAAVGTAGQGPWSDPASKRAT